MEDILAGLMVLVQPEVLTYLMIGVVAGLFIGAMPGLNDNIAFAIFIPFAFSMDAANALALMVGVYCATAIGGAIPAIVLRVPGTASSLLTSLDGNAMAKQGRASEAIGVAISSSVVGGIISAIVLIFLAPLLAAFALRFGPVENFSLGILGLASVVGMMQGSIVKGLIAAAFGLLIATVGYHHGASRYTFGSFYLYQGISLVPLLVGLFGIAAVLELVEEIARDRQSGTQLARVTETIKAVLPSRAMVARLWPTWLQSSAIGNVIGVIPGAGALIAIYLSYDQAARMYARGPGREPGAPKWGEGVPEGVAAPEAANNAVVASSMVPLLSLGIPGNSVSALFIAALEIQGLTPGPLLFQRSIDIAWMIILAFLLANLVMGPLAYIMVRSMIGFVYNLPRSILAAAICFLCLTGAYAVETTIAGVWIALLFGFIGYGFKKVGVPMAPVILAVILGERIESSLFNSLQLSGGNWLVFVDPTAHPISAILLAASLFFIVTPFVRKRRGLAREGTQNVS